MSAGKGLARFEPILQGERQRVLADLERLRQNALEDGAEQEADRGDQGVELFFQEQEGAMAIGLRDELGQIDAALARLEAGTYGLCERCGQSIGEPRLEDVPWARFCIHCAAELEGLK